MLFRSAAQWGADQELKACCEWFTSKFGAEVTADIADLLAARRPKPLSLAEEALEMLENTWKGGQISNGAAQTIRRALERLQELEDQQ